MSSHVLSPAPPQRDNPQYNQIIAELLRSLLSRAEDSATLRTCSLPRVSKGKSTRPQAEKTLLELEAKEEWRLTREENLVNTISDLRFDNPIQRK